MHIRCRRLYLLFDRDVQISDSVHDITNWTALHNVMRAEVVPLLHSPGLSSVSPSLLYQPVYYWPSLSFRNGPKISIVRQSRRGCKVVQQVTWAPCFIREIMLAASPFVRFESFRICSSSKAAALKAFEPITSSCTFLADVNPLSRRLRTNAIWLSVAG